MTISKKTDQLIINSPLIQLSLVSFIIQFVLLIGEIFLIYSFYFANSFTHIIFWVIKITSLFIIILKTSILLKNNDGNERSNLNGWHTNDLAIFLLIFAHAVLYGEIGLDLYGILFSLICILFIAVMGIYLFLYGKIFDSED